MGILHMGIDVGSTTVKYVICDDEKNILYSDYKRHFSDILATVKELFLQVHEKIGEQELTVAITGSGGLLISELLGVSFVQEVIATKTAVCEIFPKTDVVIELGGEDAKILFLTNGQEQRMNGTCAGGTGSFIDQMAMLLKTDATGLNELAKHHKTVYPIAARCGVFAKSDIQPLLNEGASKEDIASSVLQAVVTQTISGLAQGREIMGNVLFLGGPLYFLSELRHQFEETLKDKGESFKSPDNAQLFVAMGASLMHNDKSYTMSEMIEKINNNRGVPQQITRMKPLFSDDEEYKEFVSRHSKNSAKRCDIGSVHGDLFLGMDIGSTTLKAVLINDKSEICYTYYEKNDGSPLNCAAFVLRDIYSKLPSNAKIVNACATGYGEQLCKVALRIPIGEIETIAHYRGAQYFVPDVDFIIDIGGQDMKCMKLSNGVIENIMLNEACSSGCGSFIQTFAQSLGLPVSEFASSAIKSKHPVDLGTRCTVFMNSRVKQAQKEGADVSDISAGLSYSVVRNALYKVIKLRDPSLLGEKIVVQGGTFKNDAILRCFEKVSEREVTRPDIAELMGAFGASLIAKNKYEGEPCSIISSKELNEFSFKNSVVPCMGCQNHCRLTVTKFSDGRSFVSGNRCEKGNKQQEPVRKLPNMYEYKYKRVFDYKSDEKKCKRGIIGIPRVLNIYENYPLWHTFFDALGFFVVLSDESTHKIYEQGINSIPSESACYPAKIAHGHINNLIDKKIENIFYPCIPYERQEFKDSGNHFNCPIVTSYPQVIYNNMDAIKKNNINFMFPFLNLADHKSFINQMTECLKEFGVTKKEVARACELGFAELEHYKKDVIEEGAKILKQIEDEKLYGIVLVGRPYHIDPEINHGIPELINQLGFCVLSEDSVAYLGSLKRDIRVVDQWTYHTRLYEAASAVIKNERLQLIQLNSFGCGLDAVTVDQVLEIINSGHKIYTTLKIDEISNLGTARIRIRSLKATLEETQNNDTAHHMEDYTIRRTMFTKEHKKKHTVIFPQMSPFHFKLFEGVLRHEGYNAVLLENVAPEDVEAGLRAVNNDACYPSILVTGQIINAFKSGKVDPQNTSVMISQTGGGCRATNYIAFIRKALSDAGYENIPVISLNISGLEGNPGFKITLSLAHNLLRAAVLGDLLISMTLSTRPYEKINGETNKLLEKWQKELYDVFLTGKGLKLNQMVDNIIDEFYKIPRLSIKKPRVGIVGEILVKFHSGANNDCIGVIEKEGGEAVMPGIIDFMLYCLYNTNFRRDNLGGSVINAGLCDLGINIIEKYRHHMKQKLMEYDRFSYLAPNSIKNTANGAQKVLKLGHCTGEGWFLTGEMIELIESGTKNIICVQPFACLPNHVTGKGMIKELRRQYPDSNIVPIDYDPGASEVNQLNRIKLMMAEAFSNMKKVEKTEKSTARIEK